MNHLESLKKLAEDEESSGSCYESEEGEESKEEDLEPEENNIKDFYSKGVGFMQAI